MQRAQSPPLGRFWRYNYQIIAGTGYWILAIPVAASQVVTLWMMALSSDFSQSGATRIGELMTPILGAFLAAHSLAPEYRSGVGAVLACKPVSLGRVLMMRAGLGLLFALLLTFITLQVCSLGLKPIEVGPPLLASLPGLWFLSSLALLFATIFRNPIGGFAVALAMWCLDFSLGYGIHPLLSSQGLSARVDGDPLSAFWTSSKAVQLVAGTALWFAHLRQLPRLCRPPEHKDVLRMVTVTAAVLALYCVTGAATVIGYAWVKRGNLDQRDSAWLRRSLQVYGPIPVARLFGPAFHAYVTEPPTAPNAAVRPARILQLEQALQRWPRSIWADGLAYELANRKESLEQNAAPAAYLSVADRYASSPFAPKALNAILRLEGASVTDAERLIAARRLLADYSQHPEAEAGASELRDHYPNRVKAEELLKAAQAAERVSPEARQPEWRLRQAQTEADMGQVDLARQHAAEAVATAQKLQAESMTGTSRGMELRPHMARLGSVASEADALLKRLQ